MREYRDHAVVTLVVRIVFGLLLLLAAAGCSPGPQAQGQLPLARPYDQQWTFVPMTGGPGLFTACVRGDRVYVFNGLTFRAGEWTGAERASFAVAAGACR